MDYHIRSAENEILAVYTHLEIPYYSTITIITIMIIYYILYIIIVSRITYGKLKWK